MKWFQTIKCFFKQNPDLRQLKNYGESVKSSDIDRYREDKGYIMIDGNVVFERREVIRQRKIIDMLLGRNLQRWNFTATRYVIVLGREFIESLDIVTETNQFEGVWNPQNLNNLQGKITEYPLRDLQFQQQRQVKTRAM